MMENSLEYQIKTNVKKFLEKSKDKEIYLVSHFDTDGITSAAIMVQTLKKLDKQFTVKIVKTLEEEFIKKLPKDKLILFLDLASGSLNHIENTGLEDVFIIDHHEIIQAVPEKINIVNSELNGKEKISASGLTYLFCKEIDQENKEFAKLAILGMIGDRLEEEVDKLNNEIVNDGEIIKKRGLLIYPSTRPLNRVLEFCSNPYIPGVTGEMKGVLELLREVNLAPEKGNYPNLIDLKETEMRKLITAIMLRNPLAKDQNLVGDIFLIKLFNKLEDAREVSATINACSKFGKPEIAIQFCMEIASAKKRAEAVHRKRKQELISSLKKIPEIETIKGQGFIILNAENKIKDTIIGTVISILSHSKIYNPGTIIIALAYYENKIKISSRCVGEAPRNLREILNAVITQTGGEVGGHKNAAGATISQEKEQEFIDLFKKQMEPQIMQA